MMYDDVANDKHNPVPGTLINRPGGHDVYYGVVKVGVEGACVCIVRVTLGH